VTARKDGPSQAVVRTRRLSQQGDVRQHTPSAFGSRTAYQFEKDNYVTLDPEELEAVALDSTRSIEIVQFVPDSEIDELYYNSTYYIAPPEGDYAEEAFAVIREALSEKGMVGIGRVVFGSREHMIAIKPRGKGMVGTTLLYPYEVRKEAEIFDAIPDQKIDPEMVGMAHQLIKSEAGHFEPNKFEDRYDNALREIIDKKMKGATIRAPGASAPAANVVNLMEALKRSIRESAASSERRQPQTNRAPTKKAARSPARSRKAG
jgi:DNA end-binding protein Ku